MRDDLSIGLGYELVSFLDQLLLQAEIVLDDAIVNDHDFAGAIAVRMRIFFGRAAMSGPACVADAVGALDRLEADHFFQIAQLAFSAADLKPLPVAGNGNASRIVAPIFQAPQSLEDDGNHTFLADVADDAAHGRNLVVAGLV